MKFMINSAVQHKFPELIANVTIIEGFSNKPELATASEILKLLRNAEDELRARFPTKADLYNDPFVTAYFDLFREFGVNPKKVRPSHVALAERVVKGGSLPDINPAVNLYNAFSIKHLVPFGGEDLDKVDGYFELTIAAGDEKWLGIGETEYIAPKVGDLIWRDATEVSTTSLNYRQCEKTKLAENTVNGYFISEGFNTLNKDHILTVADDFIATFTKYFGGKGYRSLLTRGTPEFKLDEA